MGNLFDRSDEISPLKLSGLTYEEELERLKQTDSEHCRLEDMYCSLMKSNHFGDSRAGEVVVDMLKDLNDDKIQRKLVTIFNEFCIGLKELAKIDNDFVYALLWNYWKNEFSDRVMNLVIPEKLKFHFCNVIVGRARDKNRLK